MAIVPVWTKGKERCDRLRRTAHSMVRDAAEKGAEQREEREDRDREERRERGERGETGNSHPE